MSRKFRFLTFPLLVCFGAIVSAQAQKVVDDTQKETPKIVVISRPVNSQKAILLRWSPNTAISWRKSNEYGFLLKRYTVVRAGELVNPPEEHTLGTFLPAPLNQWEGLIDSNDNAAIMAQSLYGEQFEVGGSDALGSLINLAEEQEQRFTWGVYAAERDFSVAIKAGLGYKDLDVRDNEEYYYQVISLVPGNELEIKDGSVFTGLKNEQPLPRPLDFTVIFTDQKSILSWNTEILKQTFNGYLMERSADGKSFEKINQKPFSGLDSGGQGDGSLIYLDSIANNTKYHYRIRGVTPFGEKGPFSQVVSGTAKALLAYVPKITTKRLLDKGGVALEWEFMEQGNAHITGFELNRSDQIDGPYKKVVTGLPPSFRATEFSPLNPSNYFTLTAVGKQGSRRSSYAVLVQPIDSVPPAPPVFLEGKIDSLGIVNLRWMANSEPDLLGYRIFRGHRAAEEFSQITINPHRATQYFDTISIESLNFKVYYSLVAVDQRFNNSDRSEVLEVVKPDLIPPAPPVFSSYSTANGSVMLTWINSSSTDVARHEVYRKSSGAGQWKRVHQSPITGKTSQTWEDKDVQGGKRYAYTLIAIDHNGLESTPSPALALSLPQKTDQTAVEKLRGQIDRDSGIMELSWKTDSTANIAEWVIYKGCKDKYPLSLFQIVPALSLRVRDRQLKPNNQYIYAVHAVFKDGSHSLMERLEISY